MRAISDTTTLIYLLRTGEERLLESVFTQLLIPDGVVKELIGEPSEIERLRALSCVHFSSTPTASTAELPVGFEHLHSGEISALRLAKHLNVSLIVVDDFAARVAASALGLDVIGLLGVLKLLVEAGKISAVRPYADRAREKGFRVNQKFYENFLSQIGE